MSNMFFIGAGKGQAFATLPILQGLSNRPVKLECPALRSERLKLQKSLSILSKIDKEACKYICLAQVASDSGKGFDSSRNNSKKALEKDYSVKGLYVVKAIKAIKNNSIIKVSVNSDVIYFEWLLNGIVYQVSFHFFGQIDCSKITNNSYSNPNNSAIWNGIYGGSYMTAKIISKYLRLQII